MAESSIRGNGELSRTFRSVPGPVSGVPSEPVHSGVLEGCFSILLCCTAWCVGLFLVSL